MKKGKCVLGIASLAAITLCLGCYSQQSILVGDSANPKNVVTIRGLDTTWQISIGIRIGRESLSPARLSNVGPVAVKGDTLYVWSNDITTPVFLGDIDQIQREAPAGQWLIGGAIGAAVGVLIGGTTPSFGPSPVLIFSVPAAAVGMGALLGADEEYDFSGLVLQRRREIVRDIVSRYQVPPAPVLTQPK